MDLTRLAYGEAERKPLKGWTGIWTTLKKETAR